MANSIKPKHVKVPLILSPSLWFALVLLFFLGSFFAEPYHDLLLLGAAGAGAVSLWIYYRVSRIRLNIGRFRDEIIHGRNLETTGNLSMARGHYLKLMDKYEQVDHFLVMIKEYLNQVEARITQEAGKEPDRKPAVPHTSEAVEAYQTKLAEEGVPPAPVKLTRERRRTRRVNVEIVVDAVESLSSKLKCGALIKDVSAGGMMIESPEPFQEGDNLVLPRVPLRQDLILTDVFIRVVHCRRRPDHFMLGTEFTYLDDGERDKINAFIKSSLVKAA